MNTNCQRYYPGNEQYEIVSNILGNYMGIADFIKYFHGMSYVIYGGSVRDTLACKPPINDVDMFLLDKDACESIRLRLSGMGYYHYQHKQLSEDHQERYKHLYKLFRMRCMKNDKLGALIQLIYPKQELIDKLKMTGVYKPTLENEDAPRVIGNLAGTDLILRKFVANVDLSNCAVGFMGYSDRDEFYKTELFEAVPDAFRDIEYMQYEVQHEAIMFNEENIDERVTKMQERGWRWKYQP